MKRSELEAFGKELQALCDKYAVTLLSDGGQGELEVIEKRHMNPRWSDESPVTYHGKLEDG
jgi:hypothetical protein